MIDLCKVFGVEEGEEFKFADDDLKHCMYKVEDNVLKVKNLSFKKCREYLKSTIHLNTAVTMEVIKLPKKKEFTDDELDIFKKIPKAFKWCTRDKNKHLYCYKSKPNKDGECWFDNRDSCGSLGIFDTLFQSIKWEDEEPVFIDDYVERGTE